MGVRQGQGVAEAGRMGQRRRLDGAGGCCGAARSTG